MQWRAPSRLVGSPARHSGGTHLAVSSFSHDRPQRHQVQKSARVGTRRLRTLCAFNQFNNANKRIPSIGSWKTAPATGEGHWSDPLALLWIRIAVGCIPSTSRRIRSSLEITKISCCSSRNRIFRAAANIPMRSNSIKRVLGLPRPAGDPH